MPDASLENVTDVTALLGQTINWTLKGVIDAKVANATGYLASALLKAFAEKDLAQRVETLEKALQDLKRGVVNDEHNDDSQESEQVGNGPAQTAGDSRPDSPATGPAAERPVEPAGVHTGDVSDLPS
jgi:hypothetical protein